MLPLATCPSVNEWVIIYQCLGTVQRLRTHSLTQDALHPNLCSQKRGRLWHSIFCAHTGRESPWTGHRWALWSPGKPSEIVRALGQNNLLFYKDSSRKFLFDKVNTLKLFAEEYSLFLQIQICSYFQSNLLSFAQKQPYIYFP